MKGLKTKLLSAAAMVPALLSSAVLFAQEGSTTQVTPTVSDIVNTTALRDSILSSVANWIGIGLGIGLSLLVIYIGWRLFKKFTRG